MLNRTFTKLFQARPKIIKGVVSPKLTVPSDILVPEYAVNGKPGPRPDEIYCYDPADHDRLRKSGKLAREILEFCLREAKPGVTTDAIDKLAHTEMIRRGAYPSPLNYMGFPKSICTSVNEVACHGIPDDQALKAGDLIAIDVSLYLDGCHGDNCGSVVVPGGDPKETIRSQRLIDATKEAVEKAIEVCKPGKCITEIGKVIQQVADKRGYEVVHEFCGHGTGVYLHMLPYILHFPNKDELIMEPGMVFTIEPIFTAGKRSIFVWNDGWTAATNDGGWSAQIEHEVLITENGVEVLTSL